MWTSVGAVAALFDISCLVGSPYFDKISEIAFDLHPKIDGCNAADAELQLPHAGLLKPLVHHYFVPNPVAYGTGVSPRFDLAGKTTFTTLKKTAVSPSAQDNMSQVLRGCPLFRPSTLPKALTMCRGCSFKPFKAL